MELETFRNRVRQTFGDDLHRASPASMRDFLDQLTVDAPVRRVDNRIVLDENARTYEEVMRTFLSRAIDLPPEEAVVQLWSACAELTYAVIASHEADRLDPLFRSVETTENP